MFPLGRQRSRVSSAWIILGVLTKHAWIRKAWVLRINPQRKLASCLVSVSKIQLGSRNNYFIVVDLSRLWMTPLQIERRHPKRRLHPRDNCCYLFSIMMHPFFLLTPNNSSRIDNYHEYKQEK